MDNHTLERDAGLARGTATIDDSMPATVMSSSLATLGFWPRYVSSSTVMQHLPVIAWCVENFPHRSVLAFGTNVEGGYFAICQLEQLLNNRAECVAHGSWPESDGIPLKVELHNQEHYRDFSRLDIRGADAGTAPTPLADIIYLNTEGQSPEGPDLEDLFDQLGNEDRLLLVNLAEGKAANDEALQCWQNKIGNSHVVVLGESPGFLVGFTGKRAPLTMAPMFSSGNPRHAPPELAATFWSLGRRNLQLAGLADNLPDPRKVAGAAQAQNNLVTDAFSRPASSSDTDRVTRQAIQSLSAIAESERERLVAIYQDQIAIIQTDLKRIRAEHAAAVSDSELRASQAGRNIADLTEQVSSLRELLAAERKARFDETALLTGMLEEQRSSIQAAEVQRKQFELERGAMKVLEEELAQAKSLARRFRINYSKKLEAAGVALSAAEARRLAMDVQLAEAEARLAESNSLLAQERARRAGIEGELNRTIQELACKNQEVGRMLGSRSWRITSPARWFAAFVRGRRSH